MTITGQQLQNEALHNAVPFLLETKKFNNLRRGTVIVSIFSPKGGVGKTTLSLAMAEVLSQSKKTCVIEFDFSPGDFPSLLDINKDNNLLKALKNGVGKVMQKPEKKNFYVITGGYPDTHERFSVEEIDKLLLDLNSHFEISVFDIQPGLIENGIEILKKSDKIIIVTDDEKVTTLRTARVLDWLENDGMINLNKIDIIANKANSKLVNIPKDIVTFKIPHYGTLLTFNNKALLKHLGYYKKFILGERIPSSFFSRPPEIKKIDPHDIQVFITAAVGKMGFSEKPSDNISEEIMGHNDIAERKMEYLKTRQELVDTNNDETKELTDETMLSTHQKTEYYNIDNKKENMVYIKTNYETLNSTIANEIDNVTEYMGKADVLVVSSFSKDEINEYVSTNKKILLITLPFYEEYAKEKGIKYVFTEEASVSEIISAIQKLLNEKSTVKAKEHTTNEIFEIDQNKNIEPSISKSELKPNINLYSFEEHKNKLNKNNTKFNTDIEPEGKVAFTLTESILEVDNMDYTTEDQKDVPEEDYSLETEEKNYEEEKTYSTIQQIEQQSDFHIEQQQVEQKELEHQPAEQQLVEQYQEKQEQAKQEQLGQQQAEQQIEQEQIEQTMEHQIEPLSHNQEIEVHEDKIETIEFMRNKQVLDEEENNIHKEDNTINKETKYVSYTKQNDVKPNESEQTYIYQNESVDYTHIFQDFTKDMSAIATKYEVILKEYSLKTIQQSTEELQQKIAEALAEKEKTEMELENVKKELEEVKTKLQIKQDAALQLKKILADL